MLTIPITATVTLDPTNKNPEMSINTIPSVPASGPAPFNGLKELTRKRITSKAITLIARNTVVARIIKAPPIKTYPITVRKPY